MFNKEEVLSNFRAEVKDTNHTYETLDQIVTRLKNLDSEVLVTIDKINSLDGDLLHTVELVRDSVI